MRKIALITSAVALLGLPALAYAQSGAATGAATGAVGGAIVGGPVGAAVGAVGGAIVGGISDDTRPRFREYVVKEHRPSFKYSEDVRIGARLPEAGVTYYEVPREYGVTKYRYTIVNDRPVLVDPNSHTVVQVIE